MISYEYLGLKTKAEREALRATFVSSHSLRIDVFVLDLDGERTSDLSSRLIEGQVNNDANADINSSASLSFFDPNSTISFDSDSPADSAMYLDRMIQIRYCVKGTLLADWVEIPIFTGPIVSLSRDEDVVSIECQGKELLAMGACWTVFNRPKGANVVDTIKDILKSRAGETKFDFPDDTKGRLDKPFSISKDGSPWLAAKKLAQGINRDLFYDGRGVAVLRPVNQNSPQWTFTDGDGGSILETPSLAFTSDEISNVVVVNGGAPKGETKKITATAVPVESHPLSPKKLGRNGVNRYLVKTINNGQVRSAKAAKDLAEAVLARSLRQQVEVTFESVPIPLLEAGDCVAVETGGTSVEFNLNQFTIPLVAGGSMNIGFLDRNHFDKNRFRTRTHWVKPPKKKHTKGKNNKNNDKKK